MTRGTRTRSWLSRAVPLLLACLMTVAALAQSYEGERVKLFLKDGRIIQGLVTSQTAEKIHLELRFGRTWLNLADIEKVEVLRPPTEIYAERAAACETADDWVKLARWCRQSDVNLPEKFQECLERAIELDTDHAEARELRGDIKVGGEWYPEEEGNKKLGRKKYKGKWYDPEEYEKVKRRDELKGNKYISKYLQQLEEREGRPWATVEPIETSHYFIKCNSTEEVARRYSFLMEDLYSAYDSLFSDVEFPRYFEDKAWVYVFRNHDEFMDFSLYGQGVGGYYSPLDRAVRAYHGSFGVTGTTNMVLAHEATHQFQGMIMKNMRSVPVWLIEGMAVYYGDGTKFSRNGVELHEIPRDRLHTLKSSIKSGRYRPLEKLLMTPQWMFGPFYDHGWGVIYWLLQGDKHGAHDGEGKKVWDAYLKHVAQDMPSPREVNLGEHYKKEAEYFTNLLLEHTKYDSIEAWEKDYKEFILSTLELEALGTWSGRRWDGAQSVGVEVTFPGGFGLKPVPTEDLRADFNEAAAMQNSDGARIWLSVNAHYLTLVDEKNVNALGRGIINGYFRDLSQQKTVTESFQGVDDIIALQSRFRGRFNERQETNALGGAGAAQGGGQSTDAAEEAGEKDSGGIDPDAYYEIRVAVVVTADKVYMFGLAGQDKAFFRLEPKFDEFFKSARLHFGTGRR